MTKIILVEKSGELVESNVKSFSFDDLYKKCKFRKAMDLNVEHFGKY